jgi:hypothetical protein
MGLARKIRVKTYYITTHFAQSDTVLSPNSSKSAVDNANITSTNHMPYPNNDYRLPWSEAQKGHTIFSISYVV